MTDYKKMYKKLKREKFELYSEMEKLKEQALSLTTSLNQLINDPEINRILQKRSENVRKEKEKSSNIPVKRGKDKADAQVKSQT